MVRLRSIGHCYLKRRTRFPEKRCFFWRRRSAENRISVWKTPEAGNYAVVAQCKPQVPAEEFLPVFRHVLTQRCKQPDRLLLKFNGLGMFERKIEKYSFYRTQGLVHPQPEALATPCLSHGIECKRVWCIAIDTARKLIGQQQQRQQRTGRLGPTVEFAANGHVHTGSETALDILIVFIFLAPPQACLFLRHGGIVRIGSEPEFMYRIVRFHRRPFRSVCCSGR